MIKKSQAQWRDILIHTLNAMGATYPKMVSETDIIAKLHELGIKGVKIDRANVRGKLQDYYPGSAVFKKSRDNPAVFKSPAEAHWSLDPDYEKNIANHRKTKKLLHSKARQKNPDEKTQKAAELHVDKGLPLTEAMKAADLETTSREVVRVAAARLQGQREKEEEYRQSPPIDLSDLNLSDQDKVRLWKEQEQKRLRAQYAQDVRTEVETHLRETVLPLYNKRAADAEAVVKSRRGIMEKGVFNKIRACLHPDKILDPALQPVYAEAFALFTDLKLLLVSETDNPSNYPAFPSSLEELEEAKRRAREARQARRNKTS